MSRSSKRTQAQGAKNPVEDNANLTEEPKPLEVKRRALEVALSSGDIVLIHEPRIQDFGTYLRAYPSLIKIAKAWGVVEDINDGVSGIPLDIPENIIDEIAPLFGIMVSGLTADGFKELPFWDGVALINTIWKFSPKNVEAAQEG